jgi:hypothetical protein
VTPDRITAVSPAHLPGTVSLTVSTPDGQGSVSVTYLPRPELTGTVKVGPSGPSRANPPRVAGSSSTGKHPRSAWLTRPS